MARIFLISHTFSPAFDAEAIQANRIALQLFRRGHEIRVFTSVPADVSASDLASMFPEEFVQRVSGREFPMLWRVIGRLVPWAAELPDRHIGWYFSSRSAIRLAIKQFDPDVLYSRAQPFTSHVAANWVKGRTGLPWIAHFSDPWVDNPYLKTSFLTRWLHRRFERRIIENADASVFTNCQTKKMFLARYASKVPGRFFVIPHAHSGRISPVAPLMASDGFTLIHVGNLYGGRTLGPLIEALEALATNHELPEEFRLILVGAIDPRFKALVGKSPVRGHVHIVPPVPYAESLRWMTAADVLLSIDAPVVGTSPFLPSKLVEYLAAEKPILVLAENGSPSARFIEEVGGVIASAHDVERIATSVRKLIGAHEEELAALRPRPEAAARYCSEAIAERFEEVLDAVFNQNHKSDAPSTPR